jgi:hypothetical protein
VTINIYAEELTIETAWVRKETDGKVFYGIRLFFKSPTDLHHRPLDDDRSAITFWGPFNDPNETGITVERALFALLDTNRNLMDFRKSNPHS